MNLQDDYAPDAGDGHETPASLPTCGERLKSARESLGLDLSDVAQRLKYAARQVQALESGNYEALPSLTFQRGFVRGYAKLVGLNPDEMVAQLEMEVGHHNGPTTMQLQQIAYAPAALPAPSEVTSAWPWILGMLLAVVGIGGYTLYRWDAPVQVVRPPANTAAQVFEVNPGSASRTSPQTEVPLGANASAVSTTAPATQAPAMTTASSTAGVGVEAVAPKGGKLRLVFAGESWVEIRQGNGDVAYSGTNNVGAEQWVDGQAPFDLVIGNAAAVKVFYLGAEVKLEPYTKVSVARLQLK